MTAKQCEEAEVRFVCKYIYSAEARQKNKNLDYFRHAFSDYAVVSITFGGQYHPFSVSRVEATGHSLTQPRRPEVLFDLLVLLFTPAQ